MRGHARIAQARCTRDEHLHVVPGETKAPHECRRCSRAIVATLTKSCWQKITTEHMRTLKQRGICVVEPVTKTLACGDTGKGAMAAAEEIARYAMVKLNAYREEEAAAVELHGRPPFCP